VTLRLGEEASSAKVGVLAPDVILVAAGAVRERSTLPGADRDHVWDGDQLREALSGAGSGASRSKMSALGKLAVGVGRLTGITNDPAKLREASRLYMPLGKRVTIVGGGLVGAELAEFLADRGRKVTVLEEEAVVATEMAHPRRWRVLHDLREAGVRLETNARVIEIGATHVRFTRDGEGEAGAPEDVAADSVILARGLAANPGPAEALRSLGAAVIVIGDANGVGYIEGAIHDGFHAAIDL
jgi:2,4-dienoyl-CoA reductase (NADPH2)